MMLSLGVETEDGLGRGRERGRKETDMDEKGRGVGKRRTWTPKEEGTERDGVGRGRERGRKETDLDEKGRREGKRRTWMKKRGEGQNGRATRARPEHYHEPSHLFLLGYGESVEIVSPELHEPHVGGLGEFGDDAELGSRD